MISSAKPSQFERDAWNDTQMLTVTYFLGQHSSPVKWPNLEHYILHYEGQQIFGDLNISDVAQEIQRYSQPQTLTEEMIPMPLLLSTVTGDKGGYCACCTKHPPLFALVIPAVNLHSPFRNNFLCHDINEDERLWATPTPPTSASANYPSVRRADRWRCATDVLVGGCWRVGAGGSKGQQNHSTPVTYSWTWTSLKITAPPISLPVFYLATQQLAQRCSPACADMSFAVHCRTTTLSKTLFWHEWFVENVCSDYPQLRWYTVLTAKAFAILNARLEFILGRGRIASDLDLIL